MGWHRYAMTSDLDASEGWHPLRELNPRQRPMPPRDAVVSAAAGGDLFARGHPSWHHHTVGAEWVGFFDHHRSRCLKKPRSERSVNPCQKSKKEARTAPRELRTGNQGAGAAAPHRWFMGGEGAER
jgi:hypothetical protein